jgi:hypothetical protein
MELWYQSRTWVLARRFPERGYIAINGDGIDRWNGAPGTAAQTMVREMIQNDLRLTSMVIPFQAIAGAGVDLSTARLIDVLADGMVLERHAVPAPPEDFLTDTTATGIVTQMADGLDGEGPDVWFAYRRGWAGAAITYMSADTEELAQLGRARPGGQGWMQINLRPDSNQWEWQRRAHQLGEALFSAIGEDGRRHKWLSSFDRSEREPLYFLAQVPDGSRAVTLKDATMALAPPIVHAAWEQRRKVQRQGDVFFIPTDLTDEQVYAMSARRVRRECVIDPTPQRGQITDWPAPQKGEVRSKIPCPCNCGHLRYSSNTERGRATLSIYGTAHTATEVCVTKEGRVYVRGTAHHDPPIIGEQRQPDHINKTLGPNWHLAVRNTVPRRRTPRPVEEEVNA